MNVLSVIPTMGTGGAEAVAADLVNDQLAGGADPWLATAGGWRVDALVEHGAQVRSLPMLGRRPDHLTRSVLRLRSLAHRVRPDVVHAHNIKAAVVARAAMGRSGPTVTTVHGVAATDYPKASRLLRAGGGHVVAVSDHVAEMLVLNGLDEARVEVIENSITPLALPERGDARRELGLANDVRVVVCIARLAKQKRHDLLVEAWAHIGIDAVLLIAGDGPNRPAVKEAVARSGGRSRIRLLGERRDIGRLLAAADLAVLPTDWEGLPITVLEAMGAGVPVVASAVGGVAETVGSAAHLVEPGSVRDLTRGLRTVLADQHRREELIRSGAALVTERFGPERMLDSYRAMYATVLDRAGRAV